MRSHVRDTCVLAIVALNVHPPISIEESVRLALLSGLQQRAGLPFRQAVQCLGLEQRADPNSHIVVNTFSVTTTLLTLVTVKLCALLKPESVIFIQRHDRLAL